MAKWTARFALGTSNSVPGACIRPEDIKIVDDIGIRLELLISTLAYCFLVPASCTKLQKPPTELIMTDGCGLANATLLNALHEQFEWDNRPVAVQVRINGAKVSDFFILFLFCFFFDIRS